MMIIKLLYNWLWDNWFIQHIGIPLAIIYGVLFLFGLFCADWLIFSPHKVDYSQSFPVIMLHTADGAQIAATHLAAKDGKYTVIFSHGNGGDLASDYSYLQGFQSMGLNAFGYDYHGYGMSTGKPSERN